jgi:uncharacterized protein (TIGR02246 family)
MVADRSTSHVPAARRTNLGGDEGQVTANQPKAIQSIIGPRVPTLLSTMHSFFSKILAPANRLGAALLISASTIVAYATPPTKPEQLPNAFCEAWNRHDGHALAQLMAEDVDFVNVGAGFFHGRDDFELFHGRLLNGRFGESTLGPLESKVRFLRPDLAIVHWSWTVSADKNSDGSPRQKRYGIMTMIAEKHQEGWLVTAAHNTNAILGTVPEESGIKRAIALPQPEEKK